MDPLLVSYQMPSSGEQLIELMMYCLLKWTLEYDILLLLFYLNSSLPLPLPSSSFFLFLPLSFSLSLPPPLLQGHTVKSFTSIQLHKKAERIGACLTDKFKLNSGDHAALVYTPGIELIAAIYGCLYIG